MRLKNLVTIVTGGASGFGESICQQFATEGARLAVADLNVEKGEAVAAALRAKGHEAIFCQVDVAVNQDMGRLAATVVKHYGRLDVMVNNAGISHPNQPMLNVSEEMFDRIFQVNVKSIYLSAVHCVPIFRQQRS